jgi:TRAP-type C4-dicarboxylate transport system permease small subunit
MKTLDAIHRALQRISLWAVWIAGTALLLSAFMVTVDVLFRKFFSITMSGSDEVSGYVFAAGTTWAYSYCLLNRSNVRIDVLYNFLPVRIRAILDVVGVALLLYYMSYLTRKAYGVFWTSWTGNSVSTTTLQTPLWIPQLAWFLGLALFVVTLSFVLLYTLVGLIRRDDALVQRVAGAMSAQEEIVQETHGLDVTPIGNIKGDKGS